MKTTYKITVLLIIVLAFQSTILMAQPIPPSTPQGNPIPVGNILLLIFMGISTFIIKKRKNNK